MTIQTAILPSPFLYLLVYPFNLFLILNIYAISELIYQVIFVLSSIILQFDCVIF